ncbi:MAG TPA: hypothetical protein VMT34_12235 [Aggregatilineales bacterium]|nr:hypothetical protein [Aggregatilineales bacterium]
MAKLTQLGIAVAFLGLVIAIIGLFPSLTGVEASPGIGILQITVILVGFSMLVLGAFIYVKSAYYPGVKHNLAQEICIRLSMTGLVIAAASGWADVLGFGSHPPGTNQRPFLGILQTAGVVGGFVIASLGVVLFALLGDSHGPPDDGEPPSDEE